MYVAHRLGRVAAWARARAREERGFTLIELLIATVAALVVATATMALLITSLHLTSNYSDRVDANQEGRDALQRITEALNSSCISPAVTPVLAGSTATSLSFYSAQAGVDGPLLTPNTVTITENGTTTTPGSLLMTTQPMAGTTNNWGATGAAASFTLLPYSLAPSSSNNSAATTSGSVFLYYGYASDGTPTLAITPGSSGLTASQASEVVMVAINFEALPSDNWNAQNRPADFSDTAVLRLTPESSATGSSNSPCS